MDNCVSNSLAESMLQHTSKVHRMWYFSLQCFVTVGWATGRASDL